MSDEVMVEVPLRLMRQMQEALSLCADDLEVELGASYPENLRDQYEFYSRRYERDMGPVKQARALLAEIADRTPTVTKE